MTLYFVVAGYVNTPHIVAYTTHLISTVIIAS